MKPIPWELWKLGRRHRKKLIEIALCELEMEAIHFHLVQIWTYFTSNCLTVWEKEALQDDYLQLALRYQVITQTRIMLHVNLQRLSTKT